MRLVLDTNILAAALIRKSITREILIHPDIECLVSEFIFTELEVHKKEILQKSGLSGDDLESLFGHLKDKLILVPDEEIKHKEKALQVMNNIDAKDSIFIAIALSTVNDGIWSEDRHFDRQTLVKVWKTQDLVKHLGIVHE